MTRLKVAIRVRPLSQSELQSKSSAIIDVEKEDTIRITNIKVPEQNAGDSRERTRRFTFDYCFHQNSTQDNVFQAIQNVIGKAVKSRFNSCVLAYGQSSSGKTHTMMGFPHDPGLTPKLCDQIFGYLQESAVGDELDNLKVSVSYLEIYNEKVKDLLSSARELECQKLGLKVREHPKKGPYVQGLTEHTVCNAADLKNWLETGNCRRSVAATLTNPRSSRSHAVFTINCAGAKLHLVDLAGSERADNKCYSTCRFREGANINKSLVALGNVISALAEQNPKSLRRFVPYRDSVLTWLLKDTLGGNSNTVMIATVSPSSACYSETVNTLRFGQRAKLIVSRPVVIEDLKEGIIRQLRAEIARLRELLQNNQIPIMSSFHQSSDKLSESATTMNNHQKSEQLVPLMDVSVEAPKKLRRTFSVDHAVFNTDKTVAKPFGSHENLPSKPKKVFSPPLNTSASSSRRSSLNKPANLKTIPQRKPLVTAPIQSRVDSLRKSAPLNIKPRSQIVAAVTSRLYSKIKKKEVATDTDDLHSYITKIEKPKELSICSNARMRLRELTQRALKAHKNRNEETQTDFQVQRVKEMATDVNDLKVALLEVKNASTNFEISSKEIAISCDLLEKSWFGDELLRNSIVVTRTCGTQSADTHQKLDPSLFGIDCLNNPIYTNSVNINISHNYLNGSRLTDNISDDSLEDQNGQNVCFPTPDLISNHNSLEQSNHANNSIIPDERFETTENLIINNLQHQVLPKTIPNFCNQSNNPKTIVTTCAPQTCILNQETCSILDDFYFPELAKLSIVQDKADFNCDDCVVVHEPVVLKSIIKNIKSSFDDVTTSSCEESNFDAPDSLDYHHHLTNKQVRFNKNKPNQKMFKAMASFLEEATSLMTNLSLAAGRFEECRSRCFLDSSNELEFEISVNNLSGCKKRKSKRKCRRDNVHVQTEMEMQDEVCQTTSSCRDHCTQYEELTYQMPINKYELLLEESCKRLESKLNHQNRNKLNQEQEDDFRSERRYNPWDLSAPFGNSSEVIEDSSIESNPLTFSDYGSLPRKTHKRARTPTCSPSAFLKQLTTMRKQVIESSRQELMKSNIF